MLDMIVILDPDKKPARRKRPKQFLASSSQSERIFRRNLDGLYKRILKPANARIREMVRLNQPIEMIAAEIESVLDQARLRYKMEGDEFLTEWMMSVSTLSRSKMQAALRDITGLDIQGIIDHDGVENALTIAGIEAANLITSIPEQELGKVARAVYDNFVGVPQPENRSLLKQLQVIGSQSEARSKLIARDQTKKLSSSLNKIRQTALGVEIYIWRTSKDERVVGRPGGRYPEGNKAHGNHWKMADKYCRWDDPTVYSDDKGKSWKPRTSEMPKNHPGQDILCRCTAEPVIELEKLLALAKTP